MVAGAEVSSWLPVRPVPAPARSSNETPRVDLFLGAATAAAHILARADEVIE
jgi:hypothetical protein